MRKIVILCSSICTIIFAQGISEYYGEHKSDPSLITYVKSKYEQNMHGISYLVYPAQNSKRLWVLFNGATADRYTMWSWFWHADEVWNETAYLFLKDDDIRWYLGSQESPKTELYKDIISRVMQSFNLKSQDVCMIGHSMGGYAALYYGLLLSAGCVYVFRPQVTWDAAVTYYSIKKLRDVWVDLDELVRGSAKVPHLYLQYGEFLPDALAAHALIDAYKERQSVVIIEHTDHTEHMGYHPTHKQIEETIQYLMQST